MKKLEIAKKTVAAVVGIGVGSIMSQAIRKNATPQSKLQLVTMTVGAFALTGMVANAASRYAEVEFDGAVEQVKKIIADIKEETKES